MRSRVVLPGFALLLAACTGGSGDPIDPVPCDPEAEDCVYETTLEYPDGPFGTSIGNVIEPFTFEGYIDPSTRFGEDARVTISLTEFFNPPDGDGVYGPDSIFEEGSPKPKALMMNVAAVWCGPCKEEAAQILPKEYAALHPKGMELLSILTDSDTPGDPAGLSDLDNWVLAFSSTYPSVIDPDYKVGLLVDTTQYPANFIIDTSTMTIVEVVVGKPSTSFFEKLNQLL